jgi:hypothetical protein
VNLFTKCRNGSSQGQIEASKMFPPPAAAVTISSPGAKRPFPPQEQRDNFLPQEQSDVGGGVTEGDGGGTLARPAPLPASGGTPPRTPLPASPALPPEPPSRLRRHSPQRSLRSLGGEMLTPFAGGRNSHVPPELVGVGGEAGGQLRHPSRDILEDDLIVAVPEGTDDERGHLGCLFLFHPLCGHGRGPDSQT